MRTMPMKGTIIATFGLVGVIDASIRGLLLRSNREALERLGMVCEWAPGRGKKDVIRAEMKWDELPELEKIFHTGLPGLHVNEVVVVFEDARLLRRQWNRRSQGGPYRDGKIVRYPDGRNQRQKCYVICDPETGKITVRMRGEHCMYDKFEKGLGGILRDIQSMVGLTVAAEGLLRAFRTKNRTSQIRALHRLYERVVDSWAGYNF